MLEITLRADNKASILEASRFLKDYVKGCLTFSELAFSLIPLVREKNLSCVEVDEKISKTKLLYLQSLEAFKGKKKYLNADDRGRKDLLDEFLDNYWGKFSNWLVDQCSVSILIETGKSEYSIPDSLIQKYGYKTLDIYSKSSIKINKAISEIPYGSTDRQFEHLIERDLAYAGSNIPLAAIANYFPINFLESLFLVPPPKKPKNKTGWVEAVLSNDHAKEKLLNFPEVQKLYMVRPIPEVTDDEFKNLCTCLQYSAEYAWAICWYVRYKVNP